jgi:hypothetical protein
MMDQSVAAFDRLQEQRNRSKRATKLTSVNIAGETSDEVTSGSEFLRELRAELLKASNSGQVGSQVNSYLGELTAVTLDVHLEIRPILEKYGLIQGKFTDQFCTQLSSENMFALANDLLLTNHTEPTGQASVVRLLQEVRYVRKKGEFQTQFET